MIDLLAEPLFAEVLAHPDDLAPRLVLADRLLEAGDPRGEFIQLQCAGDADSAKRADRLLTKHRPVWNKPFKAYVRSTIFRNGFVDKALAEPALVEQGLATIVRHTPLRELQIQSMKQGDAARIAKLVDLRGLRTLDVDSNRLGAADAIALFGSPHLASLRALNASRNPIGDAGVSAIARSPQLAGLTRLSLSSTGIRAAGVAALAEATFVRTLQELRIDTHVEPAEIDLDAFAPIARAPVVALRSLMIWRCKIGDAGARMLAESPHLGALERLDCQLCDIGPDGVRAILHSPHLPALRMFAPCSKAECPPDLVAEFAARGVMCEMAPLRELR